MEKFKESLRVVKLWAKRNGLYGNILGYLGGASWAILVARACQMVAESGYNATSAHIVYVFFEKFSTWNWPDPVYIKRVNNQPNCAWNPAVNYVDREHVMPIITSTVPQMNSTVNVSPTVCNLIKILLRLLLKKYYMTAS